jgi:hypothetical protein
MDKNCINVLEIADHSSSNVEGGDLLLVDTRVPGENQRPAASY